MKRVNKSLCEDGGGGQHGASEIKILRHAISSEDEVEYDLKVVSRDANGVVDSVQCQFCRFYGREQVPGAKRKRTQSLKLFAPPYRTDNYQVHHKEADVGK